MKRNQFTELTRSFSSVFRLGLALGAAAVVTQVSFATAHKDTYYVSDHLATTVATADAAGEIAQIEADAFGTQAGNVAKDSRFTGKPYDADMGAYVFPFRNYRSDEARWMSADPSGFPDGVNSVSYAPVPSFQLDPLGLWTLSLAAGQSLPANNGGVSGPFSSGVAAQFVTNSNLSGSSISSTSYNLTASGGGVIQKDFGGWNNFTKLLSLSQSMSVSVSSTGNIVVTPAQSGTSSDSDTGFQFVGNLVIGSLVAVNSTTNQLTVSYTTQGNYNDSGVTGFSLAGGGITWDHAANLSASKITTVTFVARE